jgi:hypothetical protein
MFKQAGEHKDKRARAREVCSVVRNAPAKAGAAAPVVADKLKKLLDDGATVVSEAESINGVRTAVCASTGAAFSVENSLKMLRRSGYLLGFTLGLLQRVKT